MSKTIVLLVAAVLLAGCFWYFQTDRGSAAGPASAASAVVASAGLPVSPAVPPVVATAVPASADSAITPSSMPAVSKSTIKPVPTPVGTASDALPAWVRNPPDLGLTRTLSGDQAVSYDGRPRTVLGTKESQAKDTLGQPVLLVRDENSGQIDYFQSGLQLRLKPGNDYATFVAQRPALRSQFANADYAHVLVDAGSITSEFNALQNDPRVSSVSFLKLKPSILPR